MTDFEDKAMELLDDIIVDVVPSGGLPGPPGPPGAQDVYIQETEPTADPPWVWYKIDGLGNLVTVWIGT